LFYEALFDNEHNSAYVLARYLFYISSGS
jgi:hypothetical protein